jgi:hypothetical protein
MGGVEVGVQEADRDGICTVRHGWDARGVERLDLATVPVETAADLDAQVAVDQRSRPVCHRVVQRGPDLARDLDDVGETLRRHERDVPTPPLEQGVGRHRGAVGKKLGRRSGAGVIERSPQCVRRVFRCGRHLDHAPVVADEVGERPARVDADEHAPRLAHPIVLASLHRPMCGRATPKSSRGHPVSGGGGGGPGVPCAHRR